MVEREHPRAAFPDFAGPFGSDCSALRADAANYAEYGSPDGLAPRIRHAGRVRRIQSSDPAQWQAGDVVSLGQRAISDPLFLYNAKARLSHHELFLRGFDSSRRDEESADLQP